MRGLYVSGKLVQHEVNRILATTNVQFADQMRAKIDILDDLNILDQEMILILRNHLAAVQWKAKHEIED